METGFSQENRGWVTVTIFQELFGYSYDPEDHFASNYASPYLDHVEPTDVSPYARVLSYLEYEDGVSVLPREWTFFNSPAYVTRAEFLKMSLEAWDVDLVGGGGLPYIDVDEDDQYYFYILTAYYHGLIPYGTYFYPDDYVTAPFAWVFLEDLDDELPTPSYGDRHDADNFFIPFNINPYNMGVTMGLEHGAFSHYAKNSFVIPDRMMNLNFSHFYSSAVVEMHQDFYPVQPLTRGWSHTYNSYIVFHEDVGEDNTDLFHITWPDGSIHIYDEDSEEYLTKGVYDEFDGDEDEDIITITKKDQTEYRYDKIDSDKDIYYLVEIEDRFGNDIDIEYESAEEDDTRRIEYVEAPSGKKMYFYYLDDTDFIEKISDPIGRDIYFEYTGLGGHPVFDHPVLIDFEDAKGNNTHYQYGIDHPHEIHLLRRIDLPRGNQIKASYNGNSKLYEYQINDEAEVEIDVDFDYDDDEFYSEIRTPLPDGEEYVQNYTFNENGLVTEYLDNNTDIEIDYPGGGINVMLPDNTNMNGVDIEYDYDDHGNVIEIDMEDGMSIQEFDYNDDNTLDDYTDANGNTTYYYYDDGALVEIKDALGNSQFFTYDDHGQMLSSTNQEGITTNYEYESDGAVSDISMPEGIHHTFEYDGINRLLTHNDNGVTTSYGYDPNDNLLNITKGGLTTSFDYDENDNMIEIVNAAGTSIEFEYDDEDRVISETFGDLTREYEYNDEGQLVEMTKPSGDDVDYDYDNDGRLNETGTVIDIDYNSRNLIDDIETDAGLTEMNYDDLNRLEEVTTVHGHNVMYEYDNVGNVKKIIYPEIDGVEFYVYYQYDDKNRMTDVHLHNGEEYTHVAEYEYRDDDLLKYVTYGNDIRGHHQYDDAGRKISIAYSYIDGPLEGTVLYINSMDLNSRGNAISQHEYFYDGDLPDLAYLGTATDHSYEYDENNHIQLVDDLTQTVDSDGNTIIESKWGFDDWGDPEIYEDEYEYNIDDRLIDLNDGKVTFKYNGFGLQVERTRLDDGEYYSEYFTRDLLTGHLLMETNNLSDYATYHIYGATGLEFTIGYYGGEHYYIGDLRGSVISEISANPDDPIIFHHYDDFGKEIKKGVGGSDWELLPPTHTYRYLGKHGVYPEIGARDLYNVNRRYYNPTIGRFLSEDPIWSTNLYPYADNNPITKIDPTGNDWVSTVDNHIIPALETIVGGYHLAADVLGLIPGFGEIADGYNALLYGIQGDYKNAALSGAAAIPFVGWGATAAKYVNKVDNLLGSINEFSRLKKGVQQGFIKGNVDEIFNNLIKGAEELPSGVYKLMDGTIVGRHKNTIDINRFGEIFKIRVK